jgi:hypothetical protein
MPPSTLPSGALRCPICHYEWYSPPRPAAVPGIPQPVPFFCPNRVCNQRHWVIIYKVRLAPQVSIRVLDIVKSYGPKPEDMRRSLQESAVMDEDSIELVVTLMELKPEWAGRRIA